MIVSFEFPDATQGVSVTYISPTEGYMGITANVFVRDDLLSGLVLDVSDDGNVPDVQDAMYSWLEQQDFDDAAYEALETEDCETDGSTDIEAPDNGGLDSVPEGDADDDIEGQRQGADTGVEEETAPGEALPDTDPAVLL